MKQCIAVCLCAAAIALAGSFSPLTAQPVFLEITNPPHFTNTPSAVSPVYTYEWRTVSGNADPAELRFIFLNTASFNQSYFATLHYIRLNPNAPEWSPWQPYSPPGVGTSWTSPPQDPGSYVLAVQGRDGSGVTEPEIDETRNAIFLRNFIHSAPLLTVTGDLISPIVTTVLSTPVTEIGVPGGASVSFCWTADASAYGGVVTGFRYQWDIADPDDDGQWNSGFVPLPAQGACSDPVSFQAGQHLFVVEVIDNGGIKSRVPILAIIGPPLPVERSTWGRVKALYSSGARTIP